MGELSQENMSDLAEGEVETTEFGELVESVLSLAQQAQETLEELQTENESLRKTCAERDALISELQEKVEAQETQAAAAEEERKHLEEVKASLERANANLVEENNALQARCESLEAQIAAGTDLFGPKPETPYISPHTDAPEEIREAIEESGFFDMGEDSKAPEFHMPGRFFRR